MSLDYDIESLGHRELPPALARAKREEVADVMRRAAAYLGWPDVQVEEVASVIGGSCVACVDVVASVSGTPILVARPSLV